jgi:mannose-6-phosphate isomerase-like protein (cupin superfamily)
MPVINNKNIDQYPDFPFRAYGVFYCKPDEFPSDRHYHDCDEAWIVVSGRARVMSEGKEYIVGVGDIVWTRMGDEHQLIEILESPYGLVWLENELRGEKREGHLSRE